MSHTVAVHLLHSSLGQLQLPGQNLRHRLRQLQQQHLLVNKRLLPVNHLHRISERLQITLEALGLGHLVDMSFHLATIAMEQDAHNSQSTIQLPMPMSAHILSSRMVNNSSNINLSRNRCTVKALCPHKYSSPLNLSLNNISKLCSKYSSNNKKSRHRQTRKVPVVVLVSITSTSSPYLARAILVKLCSLKRRQRR